MAAALSAAASGVAVTTPADAAITTAWASTFSAVPLAKGTPLASGVLTAKGKPSAGATVILWANPDPAKQPVAISRTTTDSAGKWAVSVPAGTDLSADVDPRSGTANFFVESFDNVGSSVFFLPAQTSTSLAAARSVLANAVSAGSARANGRAVTLATDPTVSSGVKLNSDQSPLQIDPNYKSSTLANSVSPQSCVGTLLGTYPHIQTWLAYLGDEAPGTAEHLIFGSGTTSTLGVGVQGSNGWSVSGTSSHSTSLSVNFPAIHNVEHVNYFGTVTVTKVRQKCGGKAFSNQVFLETSALTGGFSYKPAAYIPMGQCENVQKNITVNKHDTRAYTSQAGVSTAGIIGINLTASTGYSTDFSIDYAFHAQGHPWCGLTAPPGLGYSSKSSLQTIHPGVYYG
ncbi:MAG: hypothetical protein JWO63_485 [Frankiales bacterium]|nr:hypothetical protein [Frankiales bacterium]